MQTDGFTTATGRKYATSIDCVRQVWRSEGLPAFTRGLGPTLIRFVFSLYISFHDSNIRLLYRSPFANGATFLGFEMANRFLNSL